jgi:hypothetical protein
VIDPLYGLDIVAKSMKGDAVGSTVGVGVGALVGAVVGAAVVHV